MKPELLTRIRGGYPSLSNDSGEKMRDILMEHQFPKMRYGIELEAESDFGMPERVMLYDVSEYENQIKERDKKHCDNHEYSSFMEKKSRMKKEDRLVPISTLVLYLGEGKWKGPKSISEMSQIPPEMRLEKILQDYHIQVIEADNVNPEDYTTDLKEFFKALQNRNNKEKLKVLFETAEFQSLSRDAELAIAANLNLQEMIVKMEKEEVTMCRAFQELMTEQEEKGIEKGIIAGMKALIETCKEFGASKEDTREKIVVKMQVGPEQAKEYVDLYWNEGVQEGS